MGLRFVMVVGAAVAGCGGGGGANDQNDGEVGGHCYPNGTCNVGLACSEGICSPLDAFVPDAATDAAIDAVSIDAPPDAAPFVCNDDSAFEPNDTLPTAFVTPINGTQASVTYSSLALCPATDRDYFRVTITAPNTNLEALLTYSPGVDSVGMSIVNASGAAINNGTSSTIPLTVAFNTSQVGGTYAPQNCEVAWVENSVGAFPKTIGRWCGVRRSNLVAWTSKVGPNDTDAVSGATRADHSGRLTAQWNLRDASGNALPDGQYTIRMETTDTNATMPSQNHQATFSFTKGPNAQIQTGLSNGGHTNVDITFQPNPNLRSYAANLPAGTFYIFVYPLGAAPGRSNYTLTINTTQ